MFIGEYTEKLDRRYRLILPKRYRELLKEGEHEPGSMFFVAGQAMTVYTDKGFGKLVFGLYDKLKSNTANAEERRLAHLAGIHAQVFLRRDGCVEIPRTFREIYRPDKGEEMSIVGCGDYFEIWNKESWDRKEEC